MNRLCPAVAVSIGLALAAAVGVAAAGWSSTTIGPAGGDLNAVYFFDQQHGWVGGDAGFLGRTEDGGARWTTHNVGTTDAISDVRFTRESIGFFVAGPAIFVSGDSGRSWRLARAFQPAEFGGATPELYSLHFTDRNNGWVVGSISRDDRVLAAMLASTGDGGMTWNLRLTRPASELVHIAFIDNRQGWLVGAGGAILHTADGGGQWTAQASGTTSFLYHIAFRNEREGLAVGERGTILRTVDGGRTWATATSPVRSTLLSVKWGGNDSWIVGRGGVILRSSDAGRTWLQESSSTAQHLFALFVDAQRRWAVGGNGLLLRDIP